MYQPTLGRFLSRDPLSENGVDVLTDTGFYSHRLAAMSADPWFYGGNWEHPYVYARNNPANWEDPSGLQVEKQGYFEFCDSVCNAAAKDPKLSGAGGGVLCKDGIKCICLFKAPLGGGLIRNPGECKALDACSRRHERQHLVDVDCPRARGIITRPPFKRGINPVQRECQLRAKQVGCVEQVIADLKATNVNGCNDNCIKIAQAIKSAQASWVLSNCL